jgi:hypothetical protein
VAVVKDGSEGGWGLLTEHNKALRAELFRCANFLLSAERSFCELLNALLDAHCAAL